MIVSLWLVLAWGSLLDYVLTWWRRPGEVVLLSMLQATVWIALSFTLVITPLYGLVNRVTGVPNLALLLAMALLAMAVLAFQPTLVHFTDPGSRRGRMVTGRVVALVIAGQALTFSAIEAPEAPGNLPYEYGHVPWVLEFTLLGVSLPALTAARICQLLYRWNKPVSDRKLKWQTRFGMVGWGLAALCTAHAPVAAAIGRLGWEYPLGNAQAVGEGIGAAAVLLLSNGLLFVLYGWWWQYRAYRKLEKLWSQLTRAAGIQPAAPRKLGIRDAGLLLDNRRMEIYDAALSLLPYTDTGTLERARRVAAEVVVPADVEAHAVAATFAVTIQDRSRAVRAMRPPETALLAADDELRFLLSVARAFERSPAIPKLRSQIAAGV